MKKIFILILSAFAFAGATAQVTMQPGLPATGLIQKSQLWNILVLNNSTAGFNAKIDLVLVDRNTGLELLTASTGLFTLGSGAKQLNMNMLSPIQYNYLNTAVDGRIQGLLPPGNYTACYSITGTGPGIVKETILAEECVSFDAEPLSPPMLVFPADSALLKQSPVQFSWIPPTPAGMFNNLHYEVLITEIKEGQKATEAITENIPLYNEGNQLMTTMNYPAASPSLEKNKWYAWQVVARDNVNYAGKSEVWVFKVEESQRKAEQDGTIYFYMQNDLKDVYQLNGYILHIKYFSYNSGEELDVLFQDEKGRTVDKRKQKAGRGDNYFDFKLGGQFRPGQKYKVTVTDHENKQQTLTFSITQK